MTPDSKKYLLVSEFFHPDSASTARYMTDIATGLHERGVPVEALTSHPHYHGSDFEDTANRSRHGGVRVNRVPGGVVRNTSVYHRLLNWAVFASAAAYALLWTYDSDEYELLFVTSPPVLPPVIYLCSLFGGYDYHYILYDYYPDAAAETGYIRKDGLIYNGWSRVHRRVLDNASNVIVSGENMVKKVRRNSAIDPEDIHLIHHWEDAEFISPCDKQENWFSIKHGLVERFTILYSGNIGEHHDLETLIRAAPELPEDAIILIIGEGDKKAELIDLAQRLDVHGDTVRFLPYQDWDDLPYTLTSGDVSVVTMREGFKGLCVSCKVYSALAVGQPVLVISEDDDDEARLVEQHEAGIQVRQGDVDGVRSAIMTWYEDEDRYRREATNARTAFEENYTKRVSIDKYQKVLVSRDG